MAETRTAAPRGSAAPTSAWTSAGERYVVADRRHPACRSPALRRRELRPRRMTGSRRSARGAAKQVVPAREAGVAMAYTFLRWLRFGLAAARRATSRRPSAPVARAQLQVGVNVSRHRPASPDSATTDLDVLGPGDVSGHRRAAGDPYLPGPGHARLRADLPRARRVRPARPALAVHAVRSDGERRAAAVDLPRRRRRSATDAVARRRVCRCRC